MFVVLLRMIVVVVLQFTPRAFTQHVHCMCTACVLWLCTVQLVMCHGIHLNVQCCGKDTCSEQSCMCYVSLHMYTPGRQACMVCACVHTH